ncbi:MAG: helix-turn-helix domain-containing protein [bacterium]|nr:helix-turn-helix domain-containing protein [bacterium]
MDVCLVRWPAAADRLEELRDERVPRLLVVEPDAPAPVTADELEDWVRVPVDEGDVLARVEALSRRAQALLVPGLDGDGVVRFGAHRAPLSPLEARLVEPMIDRFCAVVSRVELTRAGWPTEAPGRNALDVHVLRLRRRLDQVGLGIRTVRTRGYMLEPAA